MEEGSLRCDANVSIRRPGEPLGTRTEIKNLNSFRFLAQRDRLRDRAADRASSKAGGAITQETRLYDPAAGETRSMRSKEEAHDYRYFPDPDLLAAGRRARRGSTRCARSIPALPHVAHRALSARLRHQRRRRRGAGDVDAQLADYFEATARGQRQSARARRTGCATKCCAFSTNRRPTSPTIRVTPAMLGRLIRLIDSGAIGGKAAKEVFDEMSVDRRRARKRSSSARASSQISDPDVIRDAAPRVIERNATQVEQYRGGQGAALRIPGRAVDEGNARKSEGGSGE